MCIVSLDRIMLRYKCESFLSSACNQLHFICSYFDVSFSFIIYKSVCTYKLTAYVPLQGSSVEGSLFSWGWAI